MSSQIATTSTDKNFWQGERIRLRAIEPEDTESFFRWSLDSEAARVVDFLWPPTSLVAVHTWAQRMAMQEIRDDVMCLAVENREGQLVGSINSHSTNRRVGSFGYGVAIGEEHQGHGYGSDAVILFLRYFFEELRYQKATVTVYSCNPASIALHEKLGFQREGQLRRMVYTRGQYYDVIFYGMTSEEFAEQYGMA